MYCPRIDHFAKIQPPLYSDQAVMSCCVMTAAPHFKNYSEMMNSEWMKNIRKDFSQDRYPKECIRCKELETVGLDSDRIFYLKEHHRTVEKYGDNYLTVSLMLDNICNTACQSCSPIISTKIASLMNYKNKIRDASVYYKQLPLERITQLDFEGGEPSNSKNVKEILKNLPPNVKSIRINTNCRTFLNELLEVVERGVSILVTISTDGVGKVQEYMRWPTRWEHFIKVLNEYKEFSTKHPKLVNINLHTTLSALNVYDLDNIINFSKIHNFAHSISQLAEPSVLKISNVNSFTIKAKCKLLNSNDPYLEQLAKAVAVGENNQNQIDFFIKQQDALRKINISEYGLS